MTTSQTIDGVSHEVSVTITLTKQQERDILRFWDTCEDGQGYDVPKDRMKSLARLGLIRPTGFSRYEITDVGDAVIEELRALLDAPINPLSELEVLRAAVKELEAMRDARVDAKLAQPQGEPIYQLEYLGEGGGGWNDVDKATYERFERLPNYRPRIVYAAQPQGETVRDDSETLSYKLEYLGPISRCDVACGSYGDKFHRWDDAGPYVEYEDHLKYIEAYKGEIDYLKNISAYAEHPAPVAVVPDGYCIMPRQLTAENGAKALLLGEFKLLVTMECPECCELEEPTEGCFICDGEGEYGQKHTIPWDQIKFIYSKAVSGLAVKTDSVKPR